MFEESESGVGVGFKAGVGVGVRVGLKITDSASPGETTPAIQAHPG